MNVFHMTLTPCGAFIAVVPVRDRDRVVPEEPGELVGVVGVARHRPAGRIAPQPERDGQRAEQVVHGGQRHRAAIAGR
jgi:hypothetical protein